MVAATYFDWFIGLAALCMAGAVVVLVATIVLMRAASLRNRAAEVAAGLDTFRVQTTSLVDGIDMINDSADRILNTARTLRKVEVRR